MYDVFRDSNMGKVFSIAREKELVVSCWIPSGKPSVDGTEAVEGRNPSDAVGKRA